MPTNNLPTVTVLMSTYNGEKYLREQLNSIFAQKDVNLVLYVRDDGSTDSTIEMLKDYEKIFPLHWYQGENLGPGCSFMELLYNAPKTDFYAFADQDDIWLEQKIAVATKQIAQGGNLPLLYCSNQNVVDAYDNFIRKRHPVDVPLPGLYKTVFCNIYSGCTMVFNDKLRQILCNKKYRVSDNFLKTRMHDVWLILAASIMGQIIYDANAYIDFRRHGANVSDERLRKEIGIIEKYKNRLRHIFSKRKHNVRDSAIELLNIFKNNLTTTDLEFLKCLATYDKSSHNALCLLSNNLVIENCGNSFVILILKIIFRML